MKIYNEQNRAHDLHIVEENVNIYRYLSVSFIAEKRRQSRGDVMYVNLSIVPPKKMGERNDKCLYAYTHTYRLT